MLQRQDREVFVIQLVYRGHFQMEEELVKRMGVFLKFQESSQKDLIIGVQA